MCFNEIMPKIQSDSKKSPSLRNNVINSKPKNDQKHKSSHKARRADDDEDEDEMLQNLSDYDEYEVYSRLYYTYFIILIMT